MRRLRGFLHLSNSNVVNALASASPSRDMWR